MSAQEQKKENEPTTDVFLFLDNVKGPLTEPGREGWMKLSSVQFGVGLAISSGGRRRHRRNQTPEELEAQRKKKEQDEAADKAAAESGETEDEAWARKIKSSVETSSPSISEVTVTKETDAASPLLFHNTVLRKPARRAIIEIVQRSDKSTTRIELSTVFISGFSFSVGRSGGRPAESLSLNFRSLEFGVSAAEENRVGYDLTTEQVSLNGDVSAPFWDKKDDDDDY